MADTYPEALPTHIRRQLGFDDRPNRRFDTVIMGRRTYEPAFGMGITDPYAHLRTHVVSTRGGLPSDPNVSITDDPVAAVRALKAEDSPLGIWLAGGGRLPGALADEIDEVVLKLYPVIAGAGVPAVIGAFASRRFALVDSVSFTSGATVLTYVRADGLE